MNKTTSLILLIISGLVLGVGLLFLCASAAAPDKAAIRIALALVLIALGVGGAAWAGLTWRRLNDIEPQRLADRLLESLRAQNKFETTAAQATAELSAPAANVQAALEILQTRGEAKPETRDERLVYVFPNLKASKVVRRCPYCNTDYPVKQSIERCPHCGGKVELERT